VAAAGLAYGSDNHLLVGSKIETLWLFLYSKIHC
jgi:hypothetical protein